LTTGTRGYAYRERAPPILALGSSQIRGVSFSENCRKNPGIVFSLHFQITPTKPLSSMTDLSNPLLKKSLENIAKNLPHFVSRPTQRQMMEAVFNTLSCSSTAAASAYEETSLMATGESILVVEGPTGTGKSLGYLLPAIVAAKQTGKHLVVSSATVMLQEQLANKDIPFIAAHAGLPITYAIAKGRGRYACTQKLYQATAQGGQTDLLDTLGEEKKTNTRAEVEVLQKLAHQLKTESWSGDRDSLQEAVPDSIWSRITNDRHGCTKRECAYFRGCPFYEARNKLEKVDIIIVNHDLLLADLAMGGGVILPAPEETFYCIDEAHHLPNKAIQQFSASHTIYGSIAWLEKLEVSVGKAASLLADYSWSQKAKQAIGTICENLQTLGHGLEGVFGKNISIPLYRCPHGVLPEGFATFCTQLVPALRLLLQAITALHESLKQQKKKQAGRAHESFFERSLIDLGFFTGRVENLLAVWQLFSTEEAGNHPPVAKWMTAEILHGQIEYTLCASPVRASQLLATRLWEKVAGAVLTSATLRSLNSFEKILVDAGLDAYPATTCIALPSPFNLAKQGGLSVPRMQADPKNPEAHTKEVMQRMPDLIRVDKNEGTLVLFSSKKQMLEVAESLPASHQNRLLMQGSQPKETLLNLHFDRVGKNKASILFGLASFAEGLDLPGKACTHLIIAKLPFTMPDDPVSQTLAEWITLRGGNPFFEVSLPEASVRLIQAVGRLIRSETDTGIVTILDTRLTSKPYGRLLKQSLPPFYAVREAVVA
jgi:ATP-dependent DNA helicase DinG